LLAPCPGGFETRRRRLLRRRRPSAPQPARL